MSKCNHAVSDESRKEANGIVVTLNGFHVQSQEFDSVVVKQVIQVRDVEDLV